MNQLEVDLAEAHRPQEATLQSTAVAIMDPWIVSSQPLACSTSCMMLGTVQPPIASAPPVQTALLPMETTSVQATAT